MFYSKKNGRRDMRVWSTLRPISIGTYPREYGVVNICNYDKREWVPEIHNYAWGYIDYEQDLPKREQDHYDLRPERHANEKLEKAARAMARALEKGDMRRIQKVLEKSYEMGLIDDEEELVREASLYM